MSEKVNRLIEGIVREGFHPEEEITLQGEDELTEEEMACPRCPAFEEKK